jgi:hypothetical protein
MKKNNVDIVYARLMIVTLWTEGQTKMYKKCKYCKY